MIKSAKELIEIVSLLVLSKRRVEKRLKNNRKIMLLFGILEIKNIYF